MIRRQLEADDEAQERAIAELLGEDPDARVRRVERKQSRIEEQPISAITANDDPGPAISARVVSRSSPVKVKRNARQRIADDRKTTALAALSGGAPEAVVARALGISRKRIWQMRHE